MKSSVDSDSEIRLGSDGELKFPYEKPKKRKRKTGRLIPVFIALFILFLGGLVVVALILGTATQQSGCDVLANCSSDTLISPVDSVKSIQNGRPSENIGFNFTNRTAESPEGDHGAPDHVFIHNYPMPSAGIVTGVTFLNDYKGMVSEIPETITLLILRPTKTGWQVIYRLTLPDDDDPPAKKGITTLKFTPPLVVNKDDIFAHWQPGTRPTGPIPMNLDTTSIEGRSAGQFGFNYDDLAVGNIIKTGGFTGRRDYFINLIFEKNP